MRFAVDRLDHVVLNVRDVELAASWYQRVLGMEVETFGPDNRTALKFGGQKINLRPVDADIHAWLAARAPAAGSDDLCFVSAIPIPEVIGHLYACGVTIELGPVARIGALGPMTSVYCRDPDGNLIEIATYLRA
jgi:catechol 2,3-dioxygenase-like lactoylglutathione lyase family enzyme